jgi:hypothetical protein
VGHSTLVCTCVCYTAERCPERDHRWGPSTVVCIVGRQKQVGMAKRCGHSTIVMHAFSGGRERTDSMVRSVLPEELEDLILSKLSLHEVARVSTTSRAFHATFNRLLAAQQKARCSLAVHHFACSQQIMCIASLITRFLNADPELACRSDAVHFRICTDGTYHVVGSSKKITRFQRQFFRQDIAMPEILGSFSSNAMTLWIAAPKRRNTSVCVDRRYNLVFFSLYPCCDEDVEGLALVQTLLTWGLVSGPHSAGPQSWIKVSGYMLYKHHFTQEGLQAQIAPLLPFLSHYTKLHIGGWGRPPFRLSERKYWRRLKTFPRRSA